MMRALLITCAVLCVGCPDETMPPPSASVTTSSAVASTVEPAKPTGCHGNFKVDPKSLATLSVTPLSTLVSDKPKTGLFKIEGYPVSWHPCAPCPPKGECPPCTMTVVLSTHPANQQQRPEVAGQQIRVRVPKPSKYHRGKKFRVAVEACAGDQLVVEQRGKPVKIDSPK